MKKIIIGLIALAALAGVIFLLSGKSEKASKKLDYNLASAKDKYYGFASGGVSGRINVMGLPSMRLLKTIEPFRDFGYSKSDTHEPVFSMTNGKPDGRKLYVQDKINNAVAEIDLKTFRATRVVKFPTLKGPHHIAVTPDNRYIFTTGEFSGQIGVIDTDTFKVVKEIFAGDKDLRKKAAEAIEKKDYQAAISQNRYGAIPTLAAEHGEHKNGTLASCIDFNSVTDYIAVSPKGKYAVATDRYVYPDGTSRLHVIDTEKLEIIKSIKVGKAPHGVDISPDGKYALVSDKLSGTISVIDMDILENIKTVKVGNGPLHIVFAPDGKLAYVTLYLDHKIAEIDMATLEPTGRYAAVEWSPGHLAISPDGKYIVSLNKDSKDKYPYVGLSFPENLQLIDRASMKVVREAPIDQEPHNMKIISLSDITPLKEGSAKSPREPGVYREGGVAKVYVTMEHFKFNPSVIKVRKGERVKLVVTNVDTGVDVSHGFALQEYGINLSAGAGETMEAEFIADKAGIFTFFCSIFCGPLHLEMTGVFVVEE